jgi:WS/DGAT/MGAT family acyltransferase
MHRLNGIEANFLFRENATQNSNTGCVVTLAPRDGTPIPPSVWREHVASRLDLLPSFRWRLRFVPLGLHHPVLVDDPDFDLDRHLTNVTLPGTDDPEKELDRLLAQQLETRLDTNHPLWRMTLVTGLANGRQAVIVMVHHILMDGSALTTTLHRLFNDDVSDQLDAAVPYRPENPSQGRLLWDALVAQVAQLVGLPRLIVDSRRGFRAKRRHQAEEGQGAPQVPSEKLPVSPRYAVSNDRLFARGQLALEDIRLVKNAAGVTVNDALMAVVGLALRRYLLKRGELPQGPMVSGVMVSTEPLDAPPRQAGNYIANFITTLATDVEDPWEQMLVISGATAEARRCLELIGLDVPLRWLDVIPPFVGRPIERGLDKKARAHPENVRASAAVSNMRGAAGFHVLGSTVDGVYVYGPLADTIGLFAAAYALDQTFDMTIVSNPTALDDPYELGDGFVRALADLVALAQQHTAATA